MVSTTSFLPWKGCTGKSGEAGVKADKAPSKSSSVEKQVGPDGLKIVPVGVFVF